MADFKPLDSFQIDNGELEGLTPQLCFVLGVEYQMIYSQLERGLSFERPVHSQNQDRLRKMLNKAGAEFSLTFMQEDCSESWMWLAVIR